jgi:hypothetical protein
MPNNITDLVRRESSIDRDGQIMKPELGFFIACPDVNVSGLIAFI